MLRRVVINRWVAGGLVTVAMGGMFRVGAIEEYEEELRLPMVRKIVEDAVLKGRGGREKREDCLPRVFVGSSVLGQTVEIQVGAWDKGDSVGGSGWLKKVGGVDGDLEEVFSVVSGGLVGLVEEKEVGKRVMLGGGGLDGRRFVPTEEGREIGARYFRVVRGNGGRRGGYVVAHPCPGTVSLVPGSPRMGLWRDEVEAFAALAGRVVGKMEADREEGIVFGWEDSAAKAMLPPNARQPRMRGVEGGGEEGWEEWGSGGGERRKRGLEALKSGLEPNAAVQRWWGMDERMRPGFVDAEMQEKLQVLKSLPCVVEFDPNGGSTWNDLKGQAAKEARQHLEESVLRLVPGKFRDQLEQVTRRTRGKSIESVSTAVLLSGPPGTGKTTSARLLAQSLRMPLVLLSFESIASPMYGEAHLSLKKILDAAANVPGGCLVFVDEADTLFAARSGGSRQDPYDQRLLSQMLAWMEGAKTSSNRPVVLFASNRPEHIDPALRSRCSATIHFPLPDSQTRREIWAANARHLSTADLERLTLASDGMSGRDIVQTCATAERRLVAAIHKLDTRKHDTVAARDAAQPDPTPSLQLYLDALHQKS